MSNRDPYIISSNNETLKNLLGINDYDTLKQAETDIGFSKLLDIDKLDIKEFNADSLKRIHKYIFSDIFPWAGEFRSVPLYKMEAVIPGLSLEYTSPKDIETQLDEAISNMNNYNWSSSESDLNDKIDNFTKYLAKIWRVHPFRDGNTRTLLVYARFFALEHGLDFKLEALLSQLYRIVNPNTNRVIQYSVRDKFVLAALDDKDYPEPEHLSTLFKKVMKKKTDKNIDER